MHDNDNDLDNGHAIVKDGVIYNIDKVSHQSEQYECCMAQMDGAGVPECDSHGAIYSIWGRALWMLDN